MYVHVYVYVYTERMHIYKYERYIHIPKLREYAIQIHRICTFKEIEYKYRILPHIYNWIDITA